MSFSPQFMKRVHLLRDVEEGKKKGEDEGEKMTELKNGQRQRQ